MTSFKSFQYLGNGKVEYNSINTKSVNETLYPSFYSLDWADYPLNRVIVTEMSSKDAVKKTSHKNEKQMDELFLQFFDHRIKEIINNKGFNHKIGLLMHGKQGSGKSTIIKYYCNEFVEKYGAIVFYIDCKPGCIGAIWDWILQIRGTQDSPIIIVFEEFERLAEEQEAKLKSILDGNLSMDNMVVFATTNYPEKVGVALKDRPSRFKYAFGFDGIVGEEGAKEVIGKMIGDLFDSNQIGRWAFELKNCTVDTIKQFCLDRIMNIDNKEYKASKNSIGFNK